MPNIIASFKDSERRALLRRCQKSLWFLATDICGFNLLTPEFHKPMMDEMDQRRAARERGRFRRSELELWPRDHYKTTVRKAQMVQDFLVDPADTLTLWHAVEEMASETGVAVGTQFQKNKTLRRIVPDMVPGYSAKRFVSAKGFRLKTADPDGAPSLRVFGASAEATGGHSKRGYLDDIIGLQTLEDNGMPRIRRWFGGTVKNVVRTGCPILATGTRWDVNDIYSDWLKRPRQWEVRVRGAYELDGVPNWEGEPVLYTRQQVESKRADMSEFEFACQMMNDPIPSSERLWQPDCETFIPLKEATGTGTIFVLSDPAPAKTGSFDQRGERDRGDGTKDEWAIAVVKMRRRGERLDFILLDGSASRNWTKDEGFDEAVRLARKWRTPYVANEATGQAIALYEADLYAAARRAGATLRPIKMAWTYKGKNQYFESLVSKALRGEFLICESVPHQFVDEMLDQLRGWRCMANGRNSLRFDDRANVVSFATDPELRRFAPTSDIVLSPFDELEEEANRAIHRTRYCGI